MRVTYDPSVDAAYIYLVDSIGSGEVVQTVSGDPESAFTVNLDYDKDGYLLGIEFIGASGRLREDFLSRFANRNANPSY